MTDRTRLPLPERYTSVRIFGEAESVPVWDETDMHAYSDAKNAALRADNIRLQNEVVGPLRERVKVLEDALGEYIAAADNTITCNDKDMTTAMQRFGDADKSARAALEAK